MKESIEAYLSRILWPGNWLCDQILRSLDSVHTGYYQHGGTLTGLPERGDFALGTGRALDEQLFLETVCEVFSGQLARRTWLVSRAKDLTELSTYQCADGFRYSEFPPNDVLLSLRHGLDFVDVFGFFPAGVSRCKFAGISGATITANDNEGMIVLKFSS